MAVLGVLPQRTRRNGVQVGVCAEEEKKREASSSSSSPPKHSSGRVPEPPRKPIAPQHFARGGHYTIADETFAPDPKDHYMDVLRQVLPPEEQDNCSRSPLPVDGADNCSKSPKTRRHRGLRRGASSDTQVHHREDLKHSEDTKLHDQAGVQAAAEPSLRSRDEKKRERKEKFKSEPRKLPSLELPVRDSERSRTAETVKQGGGGGGSASNASCNVGETGQIASEQEDKQLVPWRRPLRRYTDVPMQTDHQESSKTSTRRSLPLPGKIPLPDVPEMPVQRVRRVSVAIRHEVIGELGDKKDGPPTKDGRRVTLSLREETLEDIRSALQMQQDQGRVPSGVAAELHALPTVSVNSEGDDTSGANTLPHRQTSDDEIREVTKSCSFQSNGSRRSNLSADLNDIRQKLRSMIQTGPEEPVKPSKPTGVADAQRVDKPPSISQASTSGGAASSTETTNSYSVSPNAPTTSALAEQLLARRSSAESMRSRDSANSLTSVATATSQLSARLGLTTMREELANLESQQRPAGNPNSSNASWLPGVTTKGLLRKGRYRTR